MLGVTVFALLLTPVFYVLIRRLTHSKKSEETSETHTPQLPAPATEGHRVQAANAETK